MWTPPADRAEPFASDGIETGDEGRTRVALRDPSGHEPDDAHRPVRVAEHDRRGVLIDLGDARLGLRERDRDGLLPEAVLGVEVGGEPLGLLGVIAEAELEREARVLHPSRPR